MKLITTHKGSDFDALACVVAAGLIYPDAKPVMPGSLNANVKAFLAIHKNIFEIHTPDEIDLDQVNTLIAVDTHSWNRLDRRLLKLKERPDLKIIVFDHHMDGDMDAQEKTVQETGAAITLLVKEIEKQRKLLTPIQATLFLLGLYEDTGNLSFPSTLAEDAYAAAFLLDRKADLNILTTFLKQAYGRQQKDILHEMIQDAQRMEIGGFTISFPKVEFKGRIQNLAMVMQMYREIVNVDAAFGIFKDVEQNKVMVIGRSGVDDINVGLIMKSLGGGGHPGAGSALLKSVNPDTVQETLTALIEGNQQSSVMLSDIMSYPVITINQSTPVEKVVMILREKGCTGMPVVDDDDNIVGVVSRRDFKRIRKSNQMKSPIKAFMTPNPIVIAHDRSAIEAARLMIKHDVGRIPVIQDGRIIGIITRSDVMMYFYDLLPD